jgi:hypothetical protein
MPFRDTVTDWMTKCEVTNTGDGVMVRVQDSGFRVQGPGSRVQGLGFGVRGSGFAV